MSLLKNNFLSSITFLIIAGIFITITCTGDRSCTAGETEQECHCQFANFTYAQDEVLINRNADRVYTGLVCHFSFLNLTSLPSIEDADKLIYLDISENNLTNTVNWNMSRFVNLRYLDITGNPLTEVAPKTFTGLWSMVELRISPEHATQDNFPDQDDESDIIMGNLTRLVIGGSNIDRSSMSGPVNIKNRATIKIEPITIFMDSLEELRISSITIDEFPTRFVENYTRLVSISLTDIKVKNLVNLETFRNLPKLYHFKWTRSDISNSVKSTWPTFIVNARNLKVIDFSWNYLPPVDNFLSNYNEPLELERLDFSHNCMVGLTLSNINIVNMDLSSSCPPGFLGNYRNVWIQNLDVSNSSIKDFPLEFYKFDIIPPVKYNGRPQTINLSNNPLEEVFQSNIFENFLYLKVLDLTGNNVRIPCDCRLKITLVAIPGVILKGTCLNENNERLSIDNEVRNTTAELFRTTTCNYCPAKPCLQNGTCDHVCTQWKNETCSRRQTQCQCELGYNGTLCQYLVSTITTSTTVAANTTATIDELRELKKEVDGTKESLKIAILFIGIIGFLTLVALCGVIILYNKTVLLIADHNSTSKTL